MLRRESVKRRRHGVAVPRRASCSVYPVPIEMSTRASEPARISRRFSAEIMDADDVASGLPLSRQVIDFLSALAGKGEVTVYEVRSADAAPESNVVLAVENMTDRQRGRRRCTKRRRIYCRPAPVHDPLHVRRPALQGG